MRILLTGVALLAALLLQSGLSRALPNSERYFDPFLVVLIYCGLVYGATYGMLAGACAGWIQDVHFGGSVLGLLGLTKMLVGYLVGTSSTRFSLSEPPARMLVVVLSTVFDALVLRGLLRVFDVEAYALSPLGLMVRAVVTAVVGVMLYVSLERRLARGRS